MEDVSIRNASDEDVRKLVEDRHDRYHFLEHLGNDRGTLLFALLGEALVGHLFLRLGEPEEPELREGLPDVPLLQHLKVMDGHRRRGVATWLLGEAASRLGERGHRRMALGVHPDNHAAIRLYRKVGFRTWRPEPIRVDRVDVLEDGSTSHTREDCLVFFKDL